MRLIEIAIPDDFDQIMAQKGYEYLGHGTFTKVYAKPGSSKVIRIGTMDDAWHRFAGLCLRGDNPHLPRIDKIGTRRDGHDTLLVARMERLIPVNPKNFAAQNLPLLAHIVVSLPTLWGKSDWCYASLRLLYSRETSVRPKETDPAFRRWVLEQAQACEPSMRRAIDLIGNIRGVTFDFKPENFMRRQDGTLVITDPIW